MSTVGLSMIVKNEAKTIAACLRSVSGVVSQTVIADTGSIDGTGTIARQSGAQVIEIPWADHFAEARNAALRLMETDWVLVLDADEELDDEAKQQIPRLLKKSNAGGYLVPIRNYIPTISGRGWDRIAEPNRNSHPRARTAPAYFVHENCRLFRRDPEVYFVGRVHELVEPRICAVGGRLPMAKFCIHHFGQLAEEQERDRKAAAYRDLLRLKVQDSPDDAMSWIQLGLQEYECSRQAVEPLRCFDRALLLEPKATQAALFKGMIYLDLGEQKLAIESLDAAFPDERSQALRQHLRGDALHNLGRLPEALTAYSHAVRLSGDDPILNSKLGYTEVRLGRSKSGIERIKNAADKTPEVTEVRERLMKAFIAISSLSEAGEQAEILARLEGSAKAYLRAASIRVHAQQPQQAREVLDRGIALFPDSVELRDAHNELAGESKGPATMAATQS